MTDRDHDDGRHARAVQLSEQLLQICAVGGVLARIARGIDAGSPVERIDLDARIVRERRQSREPRGVPRFQQRVFSEGGTRFRRSVDAELALAHELVEAVCD